MARMNLNAEGENAENRDFENNKSKDKIFWYFTKVKIIFWYFTKVKKMFKYFTKLKIIYLYFLVY